MERLLFLVVAVVVVFQMYFQSEVKQLVIKEIIYSPKVCVLQKNPANHLESLSSHESKATKTSPCPLCITSSPEQTNNKVLSISEI